MLAGHAVENKEVTVPAGIEQQLTRLPVEFPIDDDGSLARVPIVRIMWRGLVIPGELSCVHVQGYDAGRIKVVSFARHT